MKNSILAAFFFSCVVALAPGAMSQGKVHDMTGCLAKGTQPGTYMLTDLATGPKTVGIVSSKAKLAPHVGHKITITGVAVPEKEAMKENPKVAKAPHYMEVSAVKMVSTTCP